MKILLFVGCTLQTKFRSGVHRVTVEIAKALGGVVAVDFVKWDAIDGQLRYLDAPDLAILFGHSEAAVKPHRMAHRVQYRFGDTIDDPAKTWLLIPEISYHEANGNDAIARAVSQAREYGVRSAAIFYDLIPITNPAYHELARPHLRYVAELLRFDRIMPISVTSAKALEQHYRRVLAQEGVDDRLWSGKIVPVLLPEMNSDVPFDREIGQDEGEVVVLVGTIEPRKRQVEVLEAITRLQNDNAISRAIEIHVFGSLHPAVAAAFHDIVKANPRIRYLGYADRATILSSYRRAMFSIFASNDEGYGLPIAESLVLGIPCLTANFGAMAEVARGGGCLTCDVNDVTALTKAIRVLCTDAALRQRLRKEIASRAFRDWRMYCEDLVGVLTLYDQEIERRASTIEAAVMDALVPGRNSVTDAAGHRIMGADAAVNMRVVSVQKSPAAEGSTPSRKDFKICRYTSDLNGAAALGPELTNEILTADLWGIVTADVAPYWVDQARAASFPAVLPSDVVVNANPYTLDLELAARIRRGVAADDRRLSFAADERQFRKALHHCRKTLPEQEKTLAIVISTYNRAPFVEMNVAWLIKCVRTVGRDVHIIVVDNASTDDTVARLSKFMGNDCFSLIVNPQNTGMLGNTRVCSTLFPARHVWMIGDDDLILPEQLEAVLRVLDDQPGLPLAYVNFAVYHRERLALRDTARSLIAARHDVGKNVLPSGIYPVNVVATQHDNLFTAMYLLIFRSDLLAACFNYPFDGVPFGDLTECVPTTRWLLENYRYVDCYWHAPVSIVGNAHNSWARHRPRWHAVIMPRVFELARDAGVDPIVLNDFAQIHVGLYDEAIQMVAGEKQPIPVAAEDLEPARRVFRRELVVPKLRTQQ
jgi:glycosyltransferase involved in cell wall biosynthesis